MNTTDEICIREINASDCVEISEAFAHQGWDKPVAQYESYCRMQARNERDVLLLTVNGEFAGYLTISWSSEYAAFRDQGIPEIVDFNVLKRFQRRGLGTRLMNEAEARIKKVANTAGIGFGLYHDYGAAQVLYVRRGYVPDGNGLSWSNKQVACGDQVTVDDGLVLHITKRLD